MAQFIIAIDTGNAAFDDCPGMVMADLLRGIALNLEAEFPEALPKMTETIRDTNGNSVGNYCERPDGYEFGKGPYNLTGKRIRDNKGNPWCDRMGLCNGP